MNVKYGWLLALAVSTGIVGEACTSDDDPKTTNSALYDRLGGHQGIRTAVNAIVAQELMDPEIVTFFGAVGKAGHPTADQLEECFTNLLGKAAGGAEAYPTAVDGFTCRDMKTSHAGLHIPGAVFDKFVAIAAGVLKTAGVADADIVTIGAVLNGTRGDIVDATIATEDAGTDVTSTGYDAAAETSGNLYGRLGAHAGIRTAVNAIVGQELMDPEIASFFANVGQPGHPTADQIEECFTNLLGKAAGGAEAYPTTVDGFTCRDMKTSHAGLHIPGAVFDKFVAIAAGVLKTAGVADDDIVTVGGVLNGMKPLIIDAVTSDAGSD